jgi:tetratricopeptide (TPR) repeat protein
MAKEPRLAVVVLRQGVTLYPGGPFESMLSDAAVMQALEVQASTVAPPSEKKVAAREAKKLVKQFGDDSIKTRVQLGQLSRLAGDLADSERYYLSAVEDAPAVRVELADLYALMKRDADAQKQCEAYETACRDKIGRGEELTADERRLAASAARRRLDFPAAEAWLRDGELNTVIREALVLLYLEWWDSYKVLDPASKPTSTHVDLLQKALHTIPWYVPAMSRLLQVARLKPPTGDAARAALTEMIADGDMPATAYLLLGTDELERGNIEAAQRFLQQAQRLDPKSAVALNNLAVAMTQGPEPDLIQAARLADAAVAFSANNPHFRDTRFRILAKLGRYQDAVADLEFCAKAFTGDVEFHKTAADVYDHLKLPDLAAEHRRRASGN